MELINVIAAAVAAYAFGAAWYMTFSAQWTEASGVEMGEDGKPANAARPMPYIIAFIAALIMAGMMRHIFALSGIDGVISGLVAGLGIGLFLASPWILTCYTFAGRPLRLFVIDAGYIAGGSMVAGAVLNLF